ncbi:LIM-domain-containing protein [Mycena chlorophos]|uniref:LIM-domain-containing protein n=1 Tax=Mycena chlorophos TaxID=658473 RepID=A0A8H6T0K9_MYCCL|nr:LIM-domain-containing protein [Mycena chlorophos]
MADDLDLDSIFPEEERPPSPEATVVVYDRDEDIAATDWRQLKIRLVGSHPLWAHHLWNAGRAVASYLDHHPELYLGGSVLELGAGGGLPGLVAAKNGADHVVLSDYPDNSLLQNLETNVRENQLDPGRVSVLGYIWGRPTEQLMAVAPQGLPGGGPERSSVQPLSTRCVAGYLRAMSSSSQDAPQPARQRSGDSDLSRSPRFPGSLPRSTPPTRAATLGPDPIPPFELPPSQARSEDLNHKSRPSTPSKDLMRRGSNGSLNSAHSSGSNPQPPSSVASTSLSSSSCASCGKPMQGPFVRALGTVFHLNCFKCNDCGDVVASKFFPIEGADGKQYPLCERDYFRRLNLICAKCGMALRGSYITACNKKFHVEHFTCSLCSTLFGPSDSYYEHDGDVYCHFHYSTRFATKCAGCSSAILKQFVEINRNMRDECWHPECYMINKFWNVKVVSRRPISTAEIEGEHQEPEYAEEERRETPVSLKDKQIRMEQQVYRIWTVLSAFEESSAACISDMLRQVSNGQYLEAIRMAEKFILHVEVLFATIDDLEHHFYRLNMKGMSHVRESRMLCRKTVELFTLLSHTQETGSRRMGMTQELLALVTGLAHYLKILIRIALTGALKLERERNAQEAMSNFLDKLHLLAVQGGNPSARRMIKGHNGEVVAQSGGNVGTQGVTYGFRSLAPENAGESPFAPGVSSSASKMPSDLCVKCNQTVEEDCVRLGTYQRWHSHCVQCAVCGKKAVVPMPKEREAIQNGEEGGTVNGAPKPSTARRPPANVGLFVYEIESRKDTQFFGEVPTVILCTEHAHAGCRGGFQPVQRLEQYAFLLNVALRRLYFVLRKQGVVPLSPVESTHQTTPESDPYRNSADIMRMKSVHLDRKLSATARLPKRSTIVESPAGRTAPSEVLAAQRTQEATATASQPQQQFVPHAPQPQYPQQGQVSQQRSPSQSNSSPSYGNRARPQLGSLPTDMSQQGQVLRPAFARNNTEVMIVDESAPNSPANGPDDPPPQQSSLDNGITLADIPQLMEVAQARQEQRSLPRENQIPYIAELSTLELAIVKHAALLVLTKSPLRDQFDLDELIEMVETKRSGFWGKLFKAGDKKNVKKKGVFGVPLEFLVEREGSDSLLGATRETLRVPSFIDDVISSMRQMDMSIEGIFRKNGNIRRLKELTEAIDRDPSSVDLSSDNPVQLAALLKKFLRDLPDPLMTFKLHRLFIATQSFPQEADRRRLLHMVALIMPKSHRDTMEVLFVFLKWVASFAHMDESTGSKMDLGNLATVICPSILYSRSANAARDESFGSIRVITALLENQDEYFTVPEEFLSILQDQDYFANSLELPGKDLMKKVDTYLKVKAGSAPPPNGRPPNMPYSNSANNGSNPRFNPPNSPVMERPPPPMGASMSGPPPRPQQPGQPGLAQPSPIPPSLQQQQSMMMMSPRTPQEDWTGTPPPRPNGAATPSRPTSYIHPAAELRPS